MPPLSPQCLGTTQAGERCRSTLNIGPTGYCLAHDPDRVAQRLASRAAGGRASGRRRQLERAGLFKVENTPPAPKTLADAEAFASWLTHAVCAGGIDARSAHEAAVCLREFRSAATARALEKEVKALRAELAAAKKTGTTGAA